MNIIAISCFVISIIGMFSPLFTRNPRVYRMMQKIGVFAFIIFFLIAAASNPVLQRYSNSSWQEFCKDHEHTLRKQLLKKQIKLLDKKITR